MREPLFLEGLDGGNPLGFLAAVGVLRVTTLAWPQWDVKLSWSDRHGGWRPYLQVRLKEGGSGVALDNAPKIQSEMNVEMWLEGLDRFLRDNRNRKAFMIADNLTIPVSVFREAALEAARRARPDDRDCTDFLSAFGSDGVESKENGRRTGKIADTALRTMSGAGHQHFLGFMRLLAADVHLEHLKKSLFSSWSYDDPVENHTMRWDPVDDVRYALRWRNSSGDPSRKKSGAVWGANRLAIEALPLFPTAPVNGNLETTGFSHRKGEGTLWTWPLWTGPLGLDTVRSLLALSELCEVTPNRNRLAAVGVAEVYRSQRITEGKYRNFTPARPV